MTGREFLEEAMWNLQGDYGFGRPYYDKLINQYELNKRWFFCKDDWDKTEVSEELYLEYENLLYSVRDSFKELAEKGSIKINSQYFTPPFYTKYRPILIKPIESPDLDKPVAEYLKGLGLTVADIKDTHIWNLVKKHIPKAVRLVEKREYTL